MTRIVDMILTCGGNFMQSLNFLSSSKSYLKGFKVFNVLKTLMLDIFGSST